MNRKHQNTALEKAKKRELARLTRQHCETVLNAAKPAQSDCQESLFSDVFATDERGQTRLF